jgi:hypothetical protein
MFLCANTFACKKRKNGDMCAYSEGVFDLIWLGTGFPWIGGLLRIAWTYGRGLAKDFTLLGFHLPSLRDGMGVTGLQPDLSTLDEYEFGSVQQIIQRDVVKLSQ